MEGTQHEVAVEREGKVFKILFTSFRRRGDVGRKGVVNVYVYSIEDHSFIFPVQLPSSWKYRVFIARLILYYSRPCLLSMSLSLYLPVFLSLKTRRNENKTEESWLDVFGG